MPTFLHSDVRLRSAVIILSAIATASAIALGPQTQSAQAEPAAIVDPALKPDALSWPRSDGYHERWLRKRAKRFSRTREYKSSTGLSQIEAAEGYARIMGKRGGKGVKVAIAAGGIDGSHPDLKIKRRSRRRRHQAWSMPRVQRSPASSARGATARVFMVSLTSRN